MFQALFTKLSKQLPYIYLLYAIPMVCMTAIITPPFQTPDEPNHFSRAEQVSRLELVPVFVHDTANSVVKNNTIPTDPRIQYPDQGGFAVDKGIFEAGTLFSYVAQHSENKVPADAFEHSKNIKWGTGKHFLNFANTAIYPPIVYIMPAVGIMIGKIFSLSVITSLYISRILNGMLSIALCFCALLLARRSNVLMFIVLLFPMTISMFASVSQDAVLISCAFLLVGFIDHVEFDKTKDYSNRQLYIMIILVSIIGIAKPPYILFIFIFLFLKLNKKLKAVSIIVPVLILLSWLLVNHAAFSIKFAPAELKVNTRLQVLHIIQHPFKFIGMFLVYDEQALIGFSRMFVGILGWLDLIFSRIYYRNANIIFFVGIIIALKFGRPNHITLRAGLVLCFFMTLICVLTAQYVTWTSLESSSLSGMQGRYVLPIFPFLALAVSSLGKDVKMVPLKTLLLILVLSFPAYTAITMYKGLNQRYYELDKSR